MRLFAIATISLLTFSGCASSENWDQTTATVIAVETLNDGTTAYSLEYLAANSTAVDVEGNPIKGPIVQNVMGNQSAPKLGEVVVLEYMRDEPIMFRIPQTE